jgi:hypothetical protein
LRITNCSNKTIFSLQASKFVEIEALSVSLTPGADIGALRYIGLVLLVAFIDIEED